MIRGPPRSTLDRSSAASDVYKRQQLDGTDVYVIVDAKGIAEGQLYVDAKTFLPVKYLSLIHISEPTRPY